MLLKDLARFKNKNTTDELSVNNERRQKLIDYIRSKPAGTILTYSDFMKVVDIDNYGSIGSLIKIMLKNDQICCYGEMGGYTYAVPDDAASLLLNTPKKGGRRPGAGRPKKNAVVKPKPSDIEVMAMRFGWENPDQNNDLRAFVGWYKKQ